MPETHHFKSCLFDAIKAYEELPVCYNVGILLYDEKSEEYTFYDPQTHLIGLSEEEKSQHNAAIEKKVKVKFDYFDYGSDKQLHKRREKKYTVNPYGMVYDNEHYYLICIMAKQSALSMYRIDRIQNIEITDYELDMREQWCS